MLPFNAVNIEKHAVVYLVHHSVAVYHVVPKYNGTFLIDVSMKVFLIFGTEWHQ